MNNTWLTFSLFSENENWEIILKKAIDKFIRHLQLEDDFLIKFSNQNGAHIQLLVHVNEMQKQDVAKYAKEYFNSFFSSNTLFTKQKTDENLVFQNFPQNSIFFGLNEFNDGITQVDNEFELLLSKIILTEYKSDDRYCIELALRLYYIMFIEFSKYQQNLNGSVSSKFFKSQPEQDIEINIDIAKQAKDFIISNNTAIQEIFEELNSRINQRKSDLFYLWNNKIKKEVKNNSSDENYYELTRIISSFLGFNYNIHRLINIIVLETFKEKKLPAA